MKQLHLLLFFIVFSSTGHAQWQWGLKGGVSLSQVISIEDGENDSRRHYLGSKLIGLSASRPVGRKFRMHNELQLATYGAPWYHTVVSPSELPYQPFSRAHLSNYYVGLSVKVRYYPVPRFFAGLGMELSALIQDNRLAARDFMPLEHRILGGFGMRLFSRLDFELRYVRSLSPFFQEGGFSAGSSQVNHYHHAIQASHGISVSFRPKGRRATDSSC